MNDSIETGRRERKRQQTLDHLSDIAWQLFEAEGFDTVTMERIADRADVAKGTLYKHFPVKEALLRHHFHRELARGVPDLLQALASLPTTEAQLREFMRHGAAWAEAHKKYLLPYVQFRLSEPRTLQGEQRSGLDRIFARFIAQGQASGELRQARDPQQLAHYLEFLYLGAMLRWLLLDGITLETEYQQMLDLFFHGLVRGEQ